MSEDEVFVTIASLALSALFWGLFLWQAFSGSALPPGKGSHARFVLLLTPMACAAALLAVLLIWSAVDVRGDPVYLFFYMVMGAAWTGFAAQFLPYLGLSVRDDVAERGNLAAAWAIAGALVGVTLCFAGANIGDGPGWWVVVYAAIPSTISLAILWVCLAKAVHADDQITIDRDPAAGLRAGAFLAATGGILGRGSAGNWHDAMATLWEFAQVAWMAPIFCALAMVIESALRSTPKDPVRGYLPYGVGPAAVYLGGASAFVFLFGRWG